MAIAAVLMVVLLAVAPSVLMTTSLPASHLVALLAGVDLAATDVTDLWIAMLGILLTWTGGGLAVGLLAGALWHYVRRSSGQRTP